MSLILLVSFLLRLGLVAWSIVLQIRFRDLRLLGVVGIAIVLAPHPIWLRAAEGRHRLATFWELGTTLAGSVALVLIAHALDERRKAVKAFRASEDKFSRAFHASPNAIVISSLESGRLLEVNGSFLEMSGFSREEAVGRTSEELRMWDDPERRAQMVGKLRETGEVRDFEIHFHHRDGRTLDCLLSGSIIEADGEMCLVSMIRDVTKARRAIAEREAFVSELEAKNEELERFTYTVSHDLKSPLVTIRGFLGFVEKDAEEGNLDRLRQDLDRIRGATETMRRLLDELLDLSRIGRTMSPAEDVVLTELVEEALSYFEEPMAERGIETVVGDLLVVRGDRPRLLEVWQNLLENAVKFTCFEECPRIEVGMRPDGDEIAFFVRDNGIGIEEAYLEKIFGLFERLDPEIEGTGVGLALVKRIVEVHGGRVWAESEGAGTGSTFCFTLPGPSEMSLAESTT